MGEILNIIMAVLLIVLAVLHLMLLSTNAQLKKDNERLRDELAGTKAWALEEYARQISENAARGTYQNANQEGK